MEVIGNIINELIAQFTHRTGNEKFGDIFPDLFILQTKASSVAE